MSKKWKLAFFIPILLVSLALAIHIAFMCTGYQLVSSHALFYLVTAGVISSILVTFFFKQTEKKRKGKKAGSTVKVGLLSAMATGGGLADQNLIISASPPDTTAQIGAITATALTVADWQLAIITISFVLLLGAWLLASIKKARRGVFKDQLDPKIRLITGEKK
ncbi:MAG: hypothetical protein WCW02_00650 [Candidatus Buchananbacteria bacterium]